MIPADDTRSHGPTARDWIDLSLVPAVLVAPQTVGGLTGQLAIGPPTFDVRELRDLSDRYDLSDYQLRARGEVYRAKDVYLGGPITVAGQRYFPVAPLAMSPLLYAHFGVEAALSTPWVSGRYVTPPQAVRVLNGADTELARNGWSLRPVAAYFRGDFLACRSVAIEAGAAPEAFVPTVGATEYDLRFHALLGASLGCHGNMSPYAPKLSLEYRGRVRMYAADQAPGYVDWVAATAQLDLEWFVLQAFYAADLGRSMGDFAMVGLRLQVGQQK